MHFTEQLRQQAAAVREQVFHHPFVTGIGDGTLPLAAFRYYMCQDYVFLIDYCRVLALAAAKADDLEAIRALAPDLSTRRFRLFSRLDGFFREGGDRRASALEKIDERVFGALPFLEPFGGVIVLTITK